MTERSDSEVLQILEAPEPPPALDLPQDYLPPEWLAATGQDRYLRAMLWMTASGALLVVAGWITRIPALHLPLTIAGWLGGIAALLVCGGVFLLLLAVRCHECGYGVAMHFIRSAGFTGWLHALRTATACPCCGHHPAQDRVPLDTTEQL